MDCSVALALGAVFLVFRRRRQTKAISRSSVTLRIVNVTDVYMLDNFPSLRTLLDEQKSSNHSGKTISVLTGDFLAPYLLSSLDFGKGMIQTLNATPIDYVIWGNHEHDLPHRHVMERAKEFKGKWINTNMQSHEAMPYQIDKEVVVATSADGTHTRKVGLISMLTNQPGLYRPNAFGGATIEDPWVTARTYIDILEKEHTVDLVVPLCHLYEPQDEKTCREFDFPVVISGHDHHVVDRTINGSRLVKAGSDGHKCAIIDITWETPESKTPAVEVQIVTVADWAPDPALQAKVEQSLSVLDTLRHTQLTNVPTRFRPLNSIGVRGNVVSAATYLCSEYLKAFNTDVDTPTADCVLMPGGNIRGGRLYKTDDYFSLESLKSEIHPKMEIGVVEMPGDIISESIRTSQTRGHHPYYMQYDEGVIVDPATHTVTHIGGKPLDLKRMYSVGYPIFELTAENGPQCMTEYFTKNAPNKRHLHSTARGGQEFLLQYWAHQIWLAVWNKLDANHDGAVSKEEYRKVDTNNDGDIDKLELMKFMKTELGYDFHPGEPSFAISVLLESGDTDKNGILTWEEFKNKERRQQQTIPK
jgi:2',3'-cyclic-nucleotide 2'-phosphodiesterase (5'-nucleotidase family)